MFFVVTKWSNDLILKKSVEMPKGGDGQGTTKISRSLKNTEVSHFASQKTPQLIFPALTSYFYL